MRKKVLIVATYGDFFAAFETHNIKILNDMGVEVTLCANWTDPNYNYKTQKLCNLDFKKINITFERSPFSTKNIHCYFKLKKIMRDNKYDLVDCHNSVVSIYARLAAKKTKIYKVMYTVHGFQFYENGPKIDWLIYYPIEKFFSRYTDILLVMNNEDLKYAQKFNSDKVELIPGVGVDTNNFLTSNINKNELRHEIGISDEDFVILSIGELSKRKNHKVVIKALTTLQNKNVTYLIAGIGDYKSDLEKLAKNLGVFCKVKFLGYRSDIKSLLTIADFTIFPSFREGLMVAGIESLASGTPLLSSNRKGIKDYTEEGVNGFLFDPEDEKYLSRLIDYVSCNYDDLPNLEKNSIEVAKRFDNKVVIEKMKKIYDEVIG